MLESGSNMVDLAARLRVARTAGGLTQGQAADKLGLSRTTLVAIEQGERQVRPAELIALANLYGTSVNALTRPTAIQSARPVQFRRNATRGDEESARQAAATLNRLASSCVELERRLERSLVQRYPAERPIVPHTNINAQGEDLALELRGILGMGNAPVSELPAIVEAELGVRVFLHPLASDISEVCLFDAELGANVLLNAKHRRTRQNWSLAHALGHLLTSRHTSDVCYTVDGTKSATEKVADAFAASFLMPGSGLRRRVRDIVGLRGQITVRDLFLLAREFFVSSEAMCRRLEDLDLLASGTWETIRGRGLELANADDGPAQESAAPAPSRLAVLIAEAVTTGLVSEGQASEMLCITRLQLRRLVDDINAVGNDTLELA